MANKKILTYCKNPGLLALCASFFALSVIALGAFTRLIDAGLGCPDWPGCYGHFTVAGALLDASVHVVAYKAWAEMIHRYFAGSLSVLIFAIFAAIFLQKKFRIRSNIILASSLLLLLVYQIILGQLTVTLKLIPIIVTQHLLGGFLILSTLWLTHLNNREIGIINGTKKSNKGLLFFAVIALILLFLQIMLGAWTSTNYAALSCPDFPFCMNNQAITMHFKEAFTILSPVGVNYDGGVLPESARQTIQVMHRVGAFIVSLYLVIFMMIAMQKMKQRPEFMGSLYVILGLLCVQLAIGISNVIFKLPLVTAVSHTVVAALLLLSMITFTFKLKVAR